ncbi:MAG: hypothetical protein WBQ18_01855, partial [Solirubrobacteraceae bacterium]
RPGAPAGIGARRGRLALGLAALILLVAVLVSGIGGGVAPPPKPGIFAATGGGDPFAYRSSRIADFIARATTGNAQVLFTKSPGGAVATAARVASYRAAIDRLTAGTGVDPNLLEGLVFLESAGRPDAIAGSDVSDAAGLTQILASTGESLLGMHIDLSRSRRLTAQIDGVAAGTRNGLLAPLLARRAAADDRFNPARELAATVRYLEIARRQFGREDLAVESYHMGIGNMHQVLSDYDSGQAVPYAQLYFGSTPLRHVSTYRLLAGFGDDSELYYWRLLGAVAIMHLYRTDRPALERLAALETGDASGAGVLHPTATAHPFADPAALSAAYQAHALVPLPANSAALGLDIASGMGSEADRAGGPRSLYRGLRPVALRLLVDLAGWVRALSRVPAPLRIASTVTDVRYQQALGFPDPPATTGWSFQIERHYAGSAQANALQALLDRLQSLHLITWSRGLDTIEVTVAADATRWLKALG